MKFLKDCINDIDPCVRESSILRKLAGVIVDLVFAFVLGAILTIPAWAPTFFGIE